MPVVTVFTAKQALRCMGMETRWCLSCQRRMPIEEFHKTGSGKRRPECRWCSKERARDYIPNRSKQTRHRQEPKSHIRARATVKRAVDSGNLRRPKRCSWCNRSGMIYGHHADYTKPLDVIWICSDCHGMEHMLRDKELRYEKVRS